MQVDKAQPAVAKVEEKEEEELTLFNRKWNRAIKDYVTKFTVQAGRVAAQRPWVTIAIWLALTAVFSWGFDERLENRLDLDKLWVPQSSTFLRDQRMWKESYPQTDLYQVVISLNNHDNDAAAANDFLEQSNPAPLSVLYDFDAAIRAITVSGLGFQDMCLSPQAGVCVAYSPLHYWLFAGGEPAMLADPDRHLTVSELGYTEFGAPIDRPSVYGGPLVMLDGAPTNCINGGVNDTNNCLVSTAAAVQFWYFIDSSQSRKDGNPDYEDALKQWADEFVKICKTFNADQKSANMRFNYFATPELVGDVEDSLDADAPVYFSAYVIAVVMIAAFLAKSRPLMTVAIVVTSAVIMFVALGSVWLILVVPIDVITLFLYVFIIVNITLCHCVLVIDTCNTVCAKTASSSIDVIIAETYKQIGPAMSSFSLPIAITFFVIGLFEDVRVLRSVCFDISAIAFVEYCCLLTFVSALLALDLARNNLKGGAGAGAGPGAVSVTFSDTTAADANEGTSLSAHGNDKEKGAVPTSPPASNAYYEITSSRLVVVPVLVASLALLIAGSVGVSLYKPDFSLKSSFAENSPYRKFYEASADRFGTGGSTPNVEIVFEGEVDYLDDVQSLRLLLLAEEMTREPVLSSTAVSAWYPAYVNYLGYDPEGAWKAAFFPNLLPWLASPAGGQAYYSNIILDINDQFQVTGIQTSRYTSPQRPKSNSLKHVLQAIDDVQDLVKLSGLDCFQTSGVLGEFLPFHSAFIGLRLVLIVASLLLAVCVFVLIDPVTVILVAVTVLLNYLAVVGVVLAPQQIPVGSSSAVVLVMLLVYTFFYSIHIAHFYSAQDSRSETLSRKQKLANVFAGPGRIIIYAALVNMIVGFILLACELPTSHVYGTVLAASSGFGILFAGNFLPIMLAAFGYGQQKDYETL